MGKLNQWGILLAVTAMLSCGCEGPSASTGAALRYNGIYRGKATEKAGEYTWSYLRFYEDGTVISVVSSGQPADLKAWFDQSHENVARGQVTQQGNQLSFKTLSKFGMIDYAGKIQGDKLKLKIQSGINGNQSKDEFKFVAW